VDCFEGVYWGAVWQKQLLTEERLCSRVVGDGDANSCRSNIGATISPGCGYDEVRYGA
jgi:hypothetical protein